MGIHTRLDRMRNEVIRNKVKVAPIEDKIKETRLRWFGYVKMSVEVPMRRCEMIYLPECRRGGEQPKKS